MKTYLFTVGQIRAHLECVDPKDIRFYLNGVHVDPSKKAAVSTEGHIMLLTHVTELSGDYSGDAFTVPYDALRELVKKPRNRDYIHVDFDGGTRCNLARMDYRTGDLVSEQKDVETAAGRFPDYTRVIPEPNGKPAQYDAGLAASLQRAFELYAEGLDDTPAIHASEIAPGGERAGIMVNAKILGEVLGVIMPFRPTLITPDALTKPDALAEPIRAFWEQS